MYKIEYSKTAIKKLNKIPKNLVKRIQNKLTEIAQNPYRENPNLKKLVGREGYRLRIGDWRIIYEINNDRIVILVLEIDTRGGIYK
ncbi:type II toxin-antitoxin system RelE/ParE family toxin [Cyanobacterium aponinum UTEX 3222]|uniref:type II toxin-antitoxin system RelE family toxin n=1 Tax=Cyanobacterium aponinum TaxID=379064 RepID=UPI001680365C|nr:type II toxin-antitoxin system RelE/ParE family toxin [Cyanobacterium aponinum]MBD2395371.1 type II toxin-antitoxin system RelE/ParE family toxin [Cyanobacterium aponinum FACHB-4101]WRL41777.1 type II toxin-antitoxin system RelE/ParE family toxin [Cyanobacterium aponinum UTEX 3222]